MIDSQTVAHVEDSQVPRYPTVDDIIESNKVALKKGRNRHPHKLRVKRSALENILKEVKNDAQNGLTHQAAFIMRKLSQFQAFGGANHRTGFYVAELLLELNGLRVNVTEKQLYEFINDVDAKTIEEIEGWIKGVTTRKKP